MEGLQGNTKYSERGLAPSGRVVSKLYRDKTKSSDPPPHHPRDKYRPAVTRQNSVPDDPWSIEQFSIEFRK